LNNKLFLALPRIYKAKTYGTISTLLLPNRYAITVTNKTQVSLQISENNINNLVVKKLQQYFLLNRALCTLRR